ncbi:UDP-2,3-diacylglucosamine diphosphatase [Simiduia agarivorans]|uniref:Metallophosphoesterase n=1 Tax=Simiduia agarivorans (strain DSM 21679 / JCM 13881 / BCRC 17597 / SA1) TaxID=1117647 RepID=K4KJL3_SIMAS|nr:UDP-2,3-diacylglucosamine diphosphatase [Simiduia agarivorans]AFU99161.1 metallophosphoesterase [Simiduia agarivorans SA1 = DSM 21679]
MHHFRTVFLSDLHLGTRDCKADLLLQCLEQIRTRHIYLLGDVIDMWALSRGSAWPAAHSAVLDKLRQLACEGVRITYIPGNHDAPLRHYTGVFPDQVEVVRESHHRTARGERLLLIHGDCFDQAMHCAPWLYWLGDRAYDLLLLINRFNGRISRWRGLPYWSLAGFIKARIGVARRLLATYARLATGHARSRGFEGVICGHIHHPALEHIDGQLYGNCGDWVESCTLLAEHPDGKLQLLDLPTLLTEPHRDRALHAA